MRASTGHPHTDGLERVNKTVATAVSCRVRDNPARSAHEEVAACAATTPQQSGAATVLFQPSIVLAPPCLRIEPRRLLADISRNRKMSGRCHPQEAPPTTPQRIKNQSLRRRRRTTTVVRLKASRPQVAGSGTVENCTSTLLPFLNQPFVPNELLSAKPLLMLAAERLNADRLISFVPVTLNSV